MSTFVGIPRIPTAAPSEEMDPRDARAVRMAVSVLLDYPGDDFEIKLDAVEEALADLPEPASASLASFVSYARAAGLRAAGRWSPGCRGACPVSSPCATSFSRSYAKPRGRT